MYVQYVGLRTLDEFVSRKFPPLADGGTEWDRLVEM